MKTTEQINETEIEQIVECLSDKDIIEDEEIYILRKLKMQNDSVSFGKIFLVCYDYFNDNIYLIEDEGIKKKIEESLKRFDVYILRDSVENYYDGTSWGSYYEGEKIKQFVSENRKEMNLLINIFFRILGGE